MSPDEALPEMVAARDAMHEAERRLAAIMRLRRGAPELAAARAALQEAERRLKRVRERMQREAREGSSNP